MRHSGLRWIPREKTRKTTIGVDAETPRPADKVNRQFVAAAPNQLWVADLTTSAPAAAGSTPGSSSRCSPAEIVGWQVATSLRTDLALDALDMGLWGRRRRAGQDTSGLATTPTAAQYRDVRYTERLAEAEAVASVGGATASNAMAEALNSLFRAERIRNAVRGTGCAGIDDVESRRWRTTDHADGRGTLSHGDHHPVRTAVVPREAALPPLAPLDPTGGPPSARTKPG